MPGILRPQDLQLISSDAEVAKMDEERQLKQKKERQQLELREAFMSREIQPEAIERINNAVSVAAKQGFHQIQVVTFRAAFAPTAEKDQYRRPGVADDARWLRQAGLRVLPKGAAPPRVQAKCRDYQLPGRHAGDVGCFSSGRQG